MPRESETGSVMEFRIHGMDCADEVAILKRELVPVVKDAERLAFDILRGKILVRAGDPPATAKTIVPKVSADA